MAELLRSHLGTIGLREQRAENAPPHDRYAVGVHHVAINGGSRRAVNRAAEWARERSVEIESGPQEYAYQPGYYAVFFYDPDGLKLEIVHVPGLAA